MPYLIDGHNLIAHIADISLDDPNDEAKLVQRLQGFAARMRTECVVVFDHGIPAGASRMGNRAVRVIFASHTSSADNIMIDRINKERNPRMWTAVSSDNEVLNVARRRRMQVLRSSQFSELMRTAKPPPKPGREEAPDLHLSKSEVDEWLDLFSKE